MARIERPDSAFMEPRQKRPRQRADAHLEFIRTLPCVISGCQNRDVHAAHIRGACPKLGKRQTGAGEKPSDHWTVPLCGSHHVYGQEAQHYTSEAAFWARHRIDPFVLALSLWAVTGEMEPALGIIEEVQRITKL